MTRHDRLPAQTAIPQSQPAGDLAPGHSWIIITPSRGPICRGRFHRNGRNIGLFDPSAAAPSHHPGAPKTGQIEKNP